MTECYKLLFDLSLYYTLSGFYLSMLFGAEPSPWGFLLLVAVTLTDAALRSRKRDPRAMHLTLLLPLLVLLTRPGLRQLVQLLPAWVYLGWSLVTGQLDTDYFEFRSRFGFGMRLLLLLLPGLPFWGKLPAALSAALPYLILTLADGVCLLRMLREQQRKGLRQAVYIGVFLAVCAGLTLGRAPQMLVKGFGLLYRNAIAPLIFCAAILFSSLAYALYLLLKWLLSRRTADVPPPELQLSGIAEELGLKDAYDANLRELAWLKPVGILLAAGLAALVLVLIFRRLLGDRSAGTALPSASERTERLSPPPMKPRGPGKLRPRDPRLAVRFYYAKYLAECRSRGLTVSAGMTVTELAQQSRQLFPGVDPEKLARVYAPARYSSNAAVTRADADAAAAMWKELKQSEPKDL